MGKRKGKGKKRDGTVMAFHGTSSGALAAGAATINLNAAVGLSGRITTESDAWALFRLRSYSFRLFPRTITGSSYAACFVGSDQDTAPSGISQTTEVAASCVITAQQVVPTQWVRVPRNILSGMFPWYRTVQGAEPLNNCQPGIVAIAGTGTDPYFLEFKGVIEFKQGLDPANTPEAQALYAQLRALRQKQARDKERTQLLAQLSTAP